VRQALVIGCGYLGSRVAGLWLNRGDRVYAAARHAAHLPDGVEPIICDVLRPDTLDRLPNVDTVLYAVGFDRTSGAAMRDVYVDGLHNVLQRLPGSKRFIYISSSSVYGQTGGEWIDEASATEPKEESGRIVLDAETVLRNELPSAIILRFAGIYGPARLLRRDTIVKGEPIVGDADKWLNLIHVDDGARVILAADERAQPGRVFNVCDDHPVRRRYFYAALARALGAPEPTFVLPPVGKSTPPHEKAHRRICNRRTKDELQPALHFPDYFQGLRASV
jgi:nucleoside-diphosphate-sugar epimerase